MYEKYTFENLMDEVISIAPEEVDTREGAIYYDAIAGCVLKIAELYTEIEYINEMASLLGATGEALDLKAGEHGITRLPATPAKYNVTFDGTIPEPGERFYTDGLYFVLRYDEEAELYYLEAEIPGTGGNDVLEGENAVPVDNIDGLKSAYFGLIYENGTDVEDDEDLRDRVQEKIAGPAENGNKQHYKTWCEEIEGIGIARIYPLWNGPNTVKAVLIDGNGLPVSPSKVAEVQKIIDPADKGETVEKDGVIYVVGDGLGEGKANAGAHFTATAARSLVVDLAFTAELASGSTIDSVVIEAKELLTQYLSELVLDTEEAGDIVIRVSAIGAMLAGMRSILDYSELTVNGGTANIRPGEDYVPITGEVSVNELS